jgi:membrane protein YqaA with SNARE-associated domain
MDTHNKGMDSNKIFWFIAGSCAFVFVYIIAITFFPIPETNIRFVDIALSFLMGTVLGNANGYLLGGSADKKENKKDENNNNQQ